MDSVESLGCLWDVTEAMIHFDDGSWRERSRSI